MLVRYSSSYGGVWLMTLWLWVCLSATTLLGNNLRHVVHTHVLLGFRTQPVFPEEQRTSKITYTGFLHFQTPKQQQSRKKLTALPTTSPIKIAHSTFCSSSTTGLLKDGMLLPLCRFSDASTSIFCIINQQKLYLVTWHGSVHCVFPCVQHTSAPATLPHSHPAACLGNLS